MIWLVGSVHLLRKEQLQMMSWCFHAVAGAGGGKQRNIYLSAWPQQRDSGLILYIATGRRICNPKDSGSLGPGKHHFSIPAVPLEALHVLVEIAVEN